jgi:hypothetical protein
MYMKRMAGFIGLAFFQLMVACSSMAPQWQPTAVTDFKSVAGRWEGLLTSDDPRALHFDRATLVIDRTRSSTELDILRYAGREPFPFKLSDLFSKEVLMQVDCYSSVSLSRQKANHFSRRS